MIPSADRFVNYPGDVAHTFEIGELKGPNTINEMMTVVSIDYDPEIDKTRVGFSFRRMEATNETVAHQ